MESKLSLVPAELRQLRRWCRWSLQRNRTGKLTKVPDQSTRAVDACRPFALLQRDGCASDLGVGLVLTGGVRDREGRRLLAFDLDAAVDAQGELLPWARDFLGMLPATYTELSPSGKGLRAFAWVPGDALPTRSIIHANSPAIDGKKAGVQVFGLGPAGYVTVTGNRLDDAGTGIAQVDIATWRLFLSATGLRPDESAVAKPSLGARPFGAEPSLEELTSTMQGDPLVEAAWTSGKWESASEAYHALVHRALDAARGHAEQVVQWLLQCTAWGRGDVDDSADPMKYTREKWVRADVARAVRAHGLSGQQLAEDTFEALPAPPAAEAPKPAGSRLVPYLEFLRRREDQRFLVDGLFPSVGLVQVFGPPACGKTPFAMSLAMHIAGGRPTWFGRDIEATNRRVVYLVGEDANGLGWRAEAEQQALGLSPEVLDKHLLWSTSPGRLVDADDARRWLGDIRGVAPEGVALLVVDTQARNFGPGNENDTEDMSAFVDHVYGLAAALRCCVLLVHHTGVSAGDRGRGSSVLPGALDAIYQVTRDEDTGAVTMRSQKEKNWATPAPLVGTLVPRVVRPESPGRKAVTAITLVCAPPSPETEKFPSLGELCELVEGTSELQRLLAAMRALGTAADVTLEELHRTTRLTMPTIKRRWLPRMLELGVVELNETARGKKAAVLRLTERGAAVAMTL